MRLPVLLAIVVPASACGGVAYRDSNAAVDANPLCASAPNRPGEPMSKDGQSASEAAWRSESREQGEPAAHSRTKNERQPHRPHAPGSTTEEGPERTRRCSIDRNHRRREQ